MNLNNHPTITGNAMMQISKDNKTALLFGASGLVGSHALEFLLLHPAYSKVVVFVRKPIEQEHPKLLQHVIDFDQPESWGQLVKGDDLFCCLGTTMAKAGSRAAFLKVDYSYPIQAAHFAIENKVHQFLLVSSVGADTKSPFFYSKVKGQLEESLQRLDFWSIHIFRPSILLGERNENRWGEEIAGRIGKVIDRFTGGILTKYKPIEADVVAKAMVAAAQGLEAGTHVYPSHWLQQEARKLDKALAQR
ncbi:MAG: NAD(P)H-binding protein [Saprospiraceae bacterium]|nr:NAD(P)H-binding protein [Saprospiraceae bacterium]